MKCIITNRSPAIERALDELQRIPVNESGRPVLLSFASAPNDALLVHEMADARVGGGARCVILADAQSSAARYVTDRVPGSGVLVIGAGSGLAAKGLLRELLLDRSLDARHVAAFGVHRWAGEEHEFVMRQKVQFYSMIEISREGLSEMTDAVMMYVRQWRAFHVVLFLDAVDPAFAPGLKRPCAGGFTSRELLYVLQRLLLIQSLSSAELIVDAEADHATARLVAQLLAEFA